MLFIVLILVLAALGLLVTALITANSLWAWVSIVLSVLAGLLLVVDYFRRRSRRKQAAAEPADATVVDAEPVESEDSETEAVTSETDEPAEETEAEPAQAGEAGDPAEEKSAPADVEVVSQLDVEVVVVDEYPRYHLVECGWLEGRDTIPIAVKEARDLGFTPCARCAPDAKLAGTHRAATR
ncbi:hypothetical protein HFP15_30430 [Amycolatopsis sp. K13G38]|uniref:Uncharacterized protein n=1 Tax=Amycolatopsis acididurans TaxID=2724524 RepID=A0ABX1JBM1_9PSEU|nr:hypothetical protein [Amycolatopsis acididurans]NKQ57197.1 hypothetical protein [Amycolatopsis acididurans]